ncbi:MAG: histidine phosphatase family protein [Chloroflexota bacterium]
MGDFGGLTGEQATRAVSRNMGRCHRGMIDPPNGEPCRSAAPRLARLRGVAEAHQEGMVLVVSHGGLLHAMLGQGDGDRSGIYGRFSMRSNTGLSVVEVNDRGPVVVRLNDTSHLE